MIENKIADIAIISTTPIFGHAVLVFFVCNRGQWVLTHHPPVSPIGNPGDYIGTCPNRTCWYSRNAHCNSSYRLLIHLFPVLLCSCSRCERNFGLPLLFTSSSLLYRDLP